MKSTAAQHHPDRRRSWRPSARIATYPLGSFGGFVAMSLDTCVLAFQRPFAWRELVLQSWVVAKVSLVPTVMLAIPFTVMSVFTLNILLVDFGAGDLSGVAVSLTTVTQMGPLVTVLVVAGAAATAMCADLGARTIREELDALKVLGINPIQSLVVPRVLATGIIALMLACLVILTGIIMGFGFAVFVQHVTPGAFAAGLTILTGLPELIIAATKAVCFGLAAGLIACYKGTSVGGGPAGVGNAVNETVVFSFMALFMINVIITAIGVKATT